MKGMKRRSGRKRLRGRSGKKGGLLVDREALSMFGEFDLNPCGGEAVLDRKRGTPQP
jgi:hypothetical protein